MPSALWWKRFYERERVEMGVNGIDLLLDEAPVIDIADALVFPHTRLLMSGLLVAAVARAIVRARCDNVVAIGVLHGGRESDADLVARARSGDPSASAELRRG